MSEKTTKEAEKCFNCGGSGELPWLYWNNPAKHVRCPDCDGTGQIIEIAPIMEGGRDE